MDSWNCRQLSMVGMTRSVLFSWPLTWKGRRWTLEFLAQLDSATLRSYNRLAQALEKRCGTKHQNEVFRARFRNCNRLCGESLKELTHDLESMTHRAYPGAEDTYEAS